MPSQGSFQWSSALFGTAAGRSTPKAAAGPPGARASHRFALAGSTSIGCEHGGHARAGMVTTAACAWVGPLTRALPTACTSHCAPAIVRAPRPQTGGGRPPQAADAMTVGCRVRPHVVSCGGRFHSERCSSTPGAHMRMAGACTRTAHGGLR